MYVRVAFPCGTVARLPRPSAEHVARPGDLTPFSFEMNLRSQFFTDCLFRLEWKRLAGRNEVKDQIFYASLQCG